MYILRSPGNQLKIMIIITTLYVVLDIRLKMITLTALYAVLEIDGVHCGCKLRNLKATRSAVHNMAD